MNPPIRASKTTRLRKRLQSLSAQLNQLPPDEYAQIADDLRHVIRPGLAEDELHDLAPFPEENPNPVLRVSCDGNLLYCNQAARSLLGGECRIDQPAPAYFQDLARSTGQEGVRQLVNFDCQGRIFSLDIVPIPRYGFINIYGRDITLHIQARNAREQLLAENQHQQALLEAITDANPGGIAVLLGPELSIAHANPAFRYISPHDGKDPVGRPYQEVWSMEGTNCYASELREVLEVGKPFQAVGFERHFADGATRIFTLQARRIYWGGLPAVLLILWDTTELVKAEHRLLDTQERMRMALENSPVSLFTLDRDLRYTWQYDPRRGSSGDQILGKRPDELVPTPEMAEIVAWKRHVLKSGRSARREVHYQLGDQTVYSDISLEPLKDAKGNIIGLLESSIDVTEKKQTEVALQRSKQQILNIFDSITDCCYTLDPDWYFTIINDQALDYFQKSREELMGQCFWEIFPQALGTIVENKYRKAVREQVPVHYEVLSPLTGRWVEVHAYPSVEGLFVILRDVTERRQKQEIHRAMNEVQQVLHSTLNVDEVMQRALTAAAQALGAETAALSLRTQDGWFVKYVHGFPNELIGLQMDDRQERHAVLAIQTKQPVAISDTDRDKRVNRKHLRKWGIRSVLVVPVLLREEPVGVLFFNYYKSPFEFGQVHLDFATQLAGSVSLALENARLYQGLQKELQERKQVEKALQESEQLYRAIGESIDYGVWVCAPDGRNLYASESFLNLVGITQQQCSDFGWGDLLHPDDSERTIAAWKECVRTCGVWDIEHRFRGVDGQYHPVLARGVPVRNEQGEVIYWAGINLDISRIKKAEQALRDSDEMRRLALSAGRAGAWSWDLFSNNLQWSEEYYRIFGLEPGSIQPSPEVGFSRVHPEDRPDVEALVNEAIKNQTNIDTVHRVIWPDGSVHWVRGISRLFMNQLGQPDRLAGIAVDITEQKQAEQALRESEARFRVLADSNPLLIWVTDAKGGNQFVNRTYCEFFGITSDQIEGGQWQPFIHPEDQPGYVASFMRSVQEHTPFRGEMRVRRRDGAWRRLSTFAEPRFSTQGEYLGHIGSSIDITEQQLAAEQAHSNTIQIELQHRLLEQREQERQQIARDLHDGPMQEILGAIYALEGMIATENDSDLMNGLKAVCAILHNQVAEMRSYAGELRPPALASFGIEKAIRSHLETWQSRYPDIQVEFVCAKNLAKLPETLRLPLFRIYQEALNNITRHAGATRVNIHLDTNAAGEVQLSIRDNGAGFDLPKDWLGLARQGHLGLVGMRERVQAIGGHLEIQSQVGKGTRIQVTVPVEGNARGSQ